MKLSEYSDAAARRNIATHYEKFPDAEIRYGEGEIFRGASMREPNLQSSYKGKSSDDTSCFDVLCLYHRGQLVAALSYYVETNTMRKRADNLFARIDVVVTEGPYRGKGAGKLLVITALKYLVDRWGQKLYSIDSLAAHDAMARILQSVGFISEQRPNENFTRETLSLSEVGRDEFAACIDQSLADTIQLVRYKLR